MKKDENNKGRRKFLRFLGLATATTIVAPSVLANNFVVPEEIRKLSSQQQEFMLRYGKWMDEFIEVIRKKKAGQDDDKNRNKMISLTERAEEFKPELDVFMKDKTFSFIYKKSIERMSKEIPNS